MLQISQILLLMRRSFRWDSIQEVWRLLVFQWRYLSFLSEKQVNTVSTILRLLYIKDLRELQTNINDLIGMDKQYYRENGI